MGYRRNKNGTGYRLVTSGDKMPSGYTTSHCRTENNSVEFGPVTTKDKEKENKDKKK